MKQLHFLMVSGLFAAGLILAGCATEAPDRSTAPSAAMSQDVGDKAFHYHRQAVELREMARRLDMEAEWHAQQSGRDSEQAKRARDMANSMWATAEEADRQAREYQIQLPHGRMY